MVIPLTDILTIVHLDVRISDMQTSGFHHPDLCLPVIRRRITEELVEALLWVLETSATGGRSMTWSHWFRTKPAYHAAVHRLRKAGLVVTRRDARGEIFMDLTDRAESGARPEMRPQRLWRRKWNGLWYVLAYDVPERQKENRNALRGFLLRVRMGCLQRSVWVTPHDIRPEFDDLARAAEIRRVAFLFEATNVLGRSDQDIVQSAWDFERLHDIQNWYCERCRETTQKALTGQLSAEQAADLVREVMSAYRLALAEDPLLPCSLWPPGYLGQDVYQLHRAFLRAVASRL